MKTPLSLILTGLVLTLAACGSVGPSDDKVEQDVMEVVKRYAIPWVTQKDFDIAKRRELAEDRVEYDIDLVLMFDQNAFDLENVRNPGTSRANQEMLSSRIKALLPENNLLTVQYRETNKDFWQLDDDALQSRLPSSGVPSRMQLFLGGGLFGSGGPGQIRYR